MWNINTVISQSQLGLNSFLFIGKDGCLDSVRADWRTFSQTSTSITLCVQLGRQGNVTCLLISERSMEIKQKITFPRKDLNPWLFSPIQRPVGRLRPLCETSWVRLDPVGEIVQTSKLVTNCFILGTNSFLFGFTNSWYAGAWGLYLFIRVFFSSGESEDQWTFEF